MEVCRMCGDRRDNSAHGRRHGLGVRDEGEPQGLGWCGNEHRWGEVGGLAAKPRWIREIEPWLVF